jgi:hypothetical protein
VTNVDNIKSYIVVLYGTIIIIFRATRIRHIPKDSILDCYRDENIKYYTGLTSLRWGFQLIYILVAGNIRIFV